MITTRMPSTLRRPAGFALPFLSVLTLILSASPARVSGVHDLQAIDPGETKAFIVRDLNQGLVPADVGRGPFLIESFIDIEGLDSGVVYAAGDAESGYALWIDRGQPVFTFARSGKRAEVRGPELVVDRRYRFGGRVGADGSVTFLLSDKPVDRDPGVGLPATIQGNITPGGDPGNVIGNPEIGATPFSGNLRRSFLRTGLQTFLPTREVPGDLKSVYYDEGAVDEPWPEFPRPHFVRSRVNDQPAWQNLNGWWQYAIRPAGQSVPFRWDGDIRVPFAVESQLSGVGRWVGPENELWYRREFTLEHPSNAGERVVLNFEAVDWKTCVWVNGILLGSHSGGSNPFSFDVTDALHVDGAQQIVVRVWDPTDSEHHGRGKQTLSPVGFWYTAVTGIWQTVWLETVPETRLTGMEPPRIDWDRSEVTVIPRMESFQEGDQFRVTVRDGGTILARSSGLPGPGVRLRLDNPRPWSPSDPHLYDLDLEIVRDGRVVDRVRSYFAWRVVEWREAEDGFMRFFLNGEPVFLYGTLDQGWWPDGLLTAPSDRALRYDIEATRDMGFNMIRKHITVEPARWYYHADQLGVLVWQDMLSGFAGPLGGPPHVEHQDPHDWERPKDSSRQFEYEYAAMIETLGSFPSIVMWSVFNEGWGQYNTSWWGRFARDLDPTRPTHTVSGWPDRGLDEVFDVHVYPGPGMVLADTVPGRAVVLGEFGGLGHAVSGHLWQEDGNWGYQNIEDRDEFITRYQEMVDALVVMKSRGLACAIYTQITDVEAEINGLLTYDRAVMKIPAAKLRDIHDRLYDQWTSMQVLLPTSETAPHSWEYRFTAPGQGWMRGRDGDTGWSAGAAPFGNTAMRGHAPRTEWDGNQLWLRNRIRLTEPTDELQLRYKMHVAAAVVYINGRQVAELGPPHRLNRQYFESRIPLAETLPPGEHVITVEVRQPRRERFFDLGVESVQTR